MATTDPDLSLESERVRILSEARVIVERLAAYTALINQWQVEEEGRPNAEL